MQRVYDEMGEVQDAIDAAGRLGPRPDHRGRDGRAAGARRRRRVGAVRWGATSRRAVPAAAVEARHPAARRADQPPRRGDGRVAAAPPAGLPGMVVAITHDRYFLDEVAEWILELDRGEGLPVRGQLLRMAEQKRDRLAQEEREESARSASSPRRPSGSARPRRDAARRPRPACRPTRRCSTGSAPSRSPSR
jgi:energy-dependent translational throttle protein EttA